MTLVTESYNKDMIYGTVPQPGQVLLLFSGSEDIPLDSDSLWDSTDSSEFQTATVMEKGKTYTIQGVTISTFDESGNDDNLSLRVCTEMIVHFRGQDSLHLNLTSRMVSPSYAVYEVSPEVKFVPAEDIKATFQRIPLDGDNIWRFVGYECTIADGGVNVTIAPTFRLSFENSDFNPVFNNVTGSVENTYARIVEVSRDINLTSSRKYYSKEKLTVPANIPDSFYTSLQNISGRILGAKNGFGIPYIGSKGKYFNDMVLQFSSSKGEVLRRDAPFYSVQGFTGSVFPEGTTDEALRSISKSEMILENLVYTTTASLQRREGKDYCLEVPNLSYTVDSQDGTGSTTLLSSLPRVGTILYREGKNMERLTKVIVYSPDLGAALTTDDYGVVSSISQIQVAN